MIQARCRKVCNYKGWVIARNQQFDYFVFAVEEWEMGYGLRTPEFDAGSEQEARDFIENAKNG